MTLSARARAERDQLAASDPLVSAFVAASAGSGKTKLLTDRLLRLLLGGQDPARIQCLTFTRAAAAEMALRLQDTLAQWVTLDDAALDARLVKLDIVPNPDLRITARALFAQVLDLPGGMRIGTIHAFCQSLLRRFPLEAEISPHFQLVTDADAASELGEAREAILAQLPDAAALETLAGLATIEQFGHLVAALQVDRPRLEAALALGPPGWRQAQRRALGVSAADAAGVLAEAAQWPDEAVFRRAAIKAQAEGSRTIVDKAERLLGWLGLPAAERAENWAFWVAEFIQPSGMPRGLNALVNKKLAEHDPLLLRAYAAEQQRVLAVEAACRALQVAEISTALLDLAAPVLRAYAGHKSAAGQLDYADLIGRTARLLVDPGAAWVLFKLDGGLDHLLLDEVQDTSPAQWAIAHALTAEFFAGQGARARAAPRTVFAVGDNKQSIYSFQGADPATFDSSRDLLRRRVEGTGERWHAAPLTISFRSTAPVLQLVDAVFADPLAADGVVLPGEALRHDTDRAGDAGRVELWPLVPVPDIEAAPPWSVAEKNHAQTSAPQQLAAALATWIAEQIAGGVPLASRGRPLGAGDVLVLVRRRTDFSRALVRALKANGVKVAGLDRMVLTAQPTVADLLVLCDWLLLLDDDLSLACVLTSPLGGLSDDSLMQLAMGRPGTLWDQLRRRRHEQPEWAAAAAMLAALLARVDFVSPHVLLVEALGPFGGRAALLARFGPEAAEPIDELLAAALGYAHDHVPSLQGFVHWLRQSGAEVKREAEGAGDAVRVMTVHGAKGLQAPLVILPDTTTLPPDDGPLLWAADGEISVPIWSPRAALRCAASDQLRAEAAARRLQEYNRLLYVALTRAEDRLVVCGWETRRKLHETCWYESVRRGLASMADVQQTGEMQFVECAQTRPRAGAASAPARADLASLPPWAGQAPDWRAPPPPADPVMPTPLAPSRPDDRLDGPSPQAASPLADRDATGIRFRFGQMLHALLQHLPGLPPAERAAAARRFLERPGHLLTPQQIARLVEESAAILAHPDLAPLFGPLSRAEVPLTGLVSGLVVGGLVDRLAVLPDRVLVVDFKTNRTPPATIDDTPVFYLRQMAAYRAVLREVFPARPVACALIWTRHARVDWLPSRLLDSHAPGESVAA